MGYLDGKGKFDTHKWIRKNTVTGRDPSSVKLVERLDRQTYSRMDGLHHERNMKSALNFLADIYHDLEDEGFEPDEILEFFILKMEKKLGGRTR